MIVQRFAATLLVTLFLFSTGCATVSPTAQSKKSLQENIQTLWQAKTEKNWSLVYDMTTTAYQEKKAKDSFIKASNILVKSYSIQEVAIDKSGKKAKAIVKYTSNMMGFEFNMKSNEEWLLENNQWRLNLLPTLGNPFMKKDTK